MPRHPGVSILDSGCGTGYYLAHVLDSRPGSPALALDASPDAVTVAIAATGSPGLVADVWKPLPVRSGAADVVLCVFAPRNPTEFSRVLGDDGLLVVVTPQPTHLEQLRAAGSVLGMQDDKLGALDAALAGDFVAAGRQSLSYEVTLDAAESRLLAGMGPAGHHERPNEYAGPVTVAVDVSSYAVRPSSES